MTYELKPVSFADRVKCSNRKTEITMQGSVIVHDPFTGWVEWCKAGLKSIDGVELNDENFESELNQLSNEDIIKIGQEIKEACETGKKK